MSQKIHDILKRINYIETDMEIQKQILFSIPSDNKKKIETVMKTILDLKGQIATLRQTIKEIDPEEYERIKLFEIAAAEFKKLAEKKTFKAVTTKNEQQECKLILTDDTTIDCLVKAEDDHGNWTVLTADGRTLEYSKNDVLS